MLQAIPNRTTTFISFDVLFSQNSAGTKKPFKPGLVTGLGTGVGGAIAVDGRGVQCVIEGMSQFRQNTAIEGGALSFYKADMLLMSDVDFMENAAVDGGAVQIRVSNNTQQVSGTSLVFQNNQALRGGAGSLHFIGTGSLPVSSNASVAVQDAIVFNDVTFTENRVLDGGQGGGGLSIWKTGVLCIGCLFTNNICENSSTAWNTGGGVSISAGGSFSATDVIFEGNSAGGGGAIFTEGHANCSNVQFLNNRALTSGGALMAVTAGNSAFDNTLVELRTCIVSGNQAEMGGKHNMWLCQLSFFLNAHLHIYRLSTYSGNGRVL